MLCIGVPVLLRFATSKTKGVEVSEQLDPCRSTPVISIGPRHPSSLSDKTVYISGEAVGEGVKEGTVKMISHTNFSKVNKVVDVVVSGTVDKHFGAGVVPMSSSMRFSSGFPLRFFSPENCDDDLVDVGHPLPVQGVPPEQPAGDASHGTRGGFMDAHGGTRIGFVVAEPVLRSRPAFFHVLEGSMPLNFLKALGMGGLFAR